MLVSDKIEIKVSRGNISQFKKDLPNVIIGDIIEVNVSSLSKGSNYKVKAKCDFCNSVVEVVYKAYNNRIKKHGTFACSRKCAAIRTKQNLKKQYGDDIDNISKVPNVKKKIKETNLEKWGSEYYINSNDAKSKSKQALIKKYGVDNPQKSEEIRSKTKQTNLERYGVEYTLQSEQVRQKIESTNLEKYGFKVASKCDKVIKKIKDTNVERWGYVSPLMNESVLKKSRKTLLENWNVDNPQKSEEIRNKTKQTNLERYGVEYLMQSEDILDKARETNLKKYGCEYYFMTSEFKEYYKNYFLLRYGVDHYSKTQEFKDKFKKSMIDKYGELNVSINEEFRKENFTIAKDTNYIKYIGDNISLFRCDCGEDHTFESSDNYSHRKILNIKLCTICNPISELSSIKEKEVLNFIKSIYNGEIISNYRDGKEIDIYLPQLKLGFEFNGLYYHSELFKHKKYHQEKLEFFGSKGIRVINIWEDDWVYKNDIIKSQIRNWLNLTPNKIYAIKCEVRQIDVKCVREFLNGNHIQGFVRSKVKLGLFHNNDLVSVMLFDNLEGRKSMGHGGWNLSRFCNKINYRVVGAASKLLKWFIRKYKVKRVISYADKSWSLGSLYESIGFDLVSEVRPDYKYIINGVRVNKSKFRKSNVKIQESKFANKNNMFKIWDCGKMKFELKILDI